MKEDYDAARCVATSSEKRGNRFLTSVFPKGNPTKVGYPHVPVSRMIDKMEDVRTGGGGPVTWEAIPMQ